MSIYKKNALGENWYAARVLVSLDSAWYRFHLMEQQAFDAIRK